MSTQPKEIIFEEAAREKLYSGMKQLADVVSSTLGPRGRNVGLDKGWGAPTITNDGSNIVRDFELKDPYENMGVAIVKEVVQKIKEKCGDGTTTGTILVKTLVQLGLKYVSSGASPISLKRGMEKAIDAVISSLEKAAISIESQKEIVNIATASASSNQEIGKMIGEAIEKVGKTGVITIEEAKGTETSIEIVEGMQFDRGYLSSYFITNNEKMIVEMKNAALLLVDKKISSIHDLLPILQSIASTGKELLIIAEDVEGDVLSTLVVNRMRGTLKVCAVKSPGFGDRRKALLEDIAIMTGATVVNEEAGVSLKDADQSVLGQCEIITITKEHTTIVSSHGNKTLIESRVRQIEAEIKNTTSSYDREKLEERKAKLSGGVAQIRVGAATEPELKNKKQAFEDSLNSTKAALESGVVAGGGAELVRAARNAIPKLNLVGDELLGAKIVQVACEAPLRQIVANSGKDPSVILGEILTKGPHYGFNALTDEIENLVTSGVIDPVKVIKNCLTYASSAAGITLISEALISDAPEDDSSEK